MGRHLQKERQEKEQRQKKLVRIFVSIGIGLVIMLIYVIISLRPLDEITDYRISVAQRSDGSLDITYSLQWKVLNDSKEGPLSWVKLGMANPDYTVKELGGAAKGIRYQPAASSQNPMLELNLDRSYYKGETASFWFTVHQQKMLCKNFENPDEPFYDFTPGWFDQIRVSHYEFTWEQRKNIKTHNADRWENGKLVWEGALKKGESRQMKLTCSMDGFIGPELAVWQEYRNSSKGESPVSAATVLTILTITFCFAFGVIGGSDEDHYEGGRGYHGARYHGGGGGGGGCACACAGCACACACAGGGRAGCSKKDFYHTRQKSQKSTINSQF